MLLGVIALCLSIACSQCVPSTGAEELLLGKEYYVCFTLNGNERSVFHPKVDEYGRYTYRGCTGCVGVVHSVVYEKVSTNASTPIFVQLSISSKDASGEKVITANSVPKLYTGLKYVSSYFTYLTAVVNVEKGVVKSISWDDGCLTCLPGSCEQNSVVTKNGTVELISETDPVYKAYRGSNCVESANACDKEGKNCDLTIFLVWEGSDRKGRVFHSANVRLSRFQSGSLESALNTL